MTLSRFVIVAAVLAALGLIVFPMIVALADMTTDIAASDRKPSVAESSSAPTAEGTKGSVRVPGGTYWIGVDAAEVAALVSADPASANDQRSAYASTPRHQVTVSDFEIDVCEVTCREYAAFLREHPALPAPHYDAPSGRVELWPHRAVPEGCDDLPVMAVSADEAAQYAAWRGRRLPTEAEWEVAARFTTIEGERRYWPWTDAVAAVLEDRPRSSAKGGVNFALLHPVGTRPDEASFLGIQDLAGNVSEWTSSRFLAYDGFQNVTLGDTSMRATQFNEERVVLRGAHEHDRGLTRTTFLRCGRWRVPSGKSRVRRMAAHRRRPSSPEASFPRRPMRTRAKMKARWEG